jgi:hypothetical protein
MMIAHDKKTLNLILENFDCPLYEQLKNTRNGRKIVKSYGVSDNTDDQVWDEWHKKDGIVYIDEFNSYVNSNNTIDIILKNNKLH